MDEPQGKTTHYDLAVIGGGINGCGIAADAAGRGLKVLLVEQDDLASATSSASSKLIHGGLRYLEYYAFRLVRESLEEREILLANAPHLVRPLRFIIPHVPGMRARPLMRAGLFLYDHLARRRRIPSSSTVDMAQDRAARPLAPRYSSGFSYWDCQVDDARLVVLVARQAAALGADIRTRTQLRSAVAEDGSWRLVLGVKDARVPSATPAVKEVRARILVNAAGPWVGRLAATAIRRSEAMPQVPLRLVKGSHIVVPRIAGAETAYLLQAPDRRVVFLLPFAERFTLIGTTDIAYDGDPGEAIISADEEAYLLNVANGFLAAPLSLADIVWRYSGVRPLFDDASDNPSAVTRDYKLVLDATAGEPPVLTVVGGKVTTYRRLAEAAMQLIAPFAGEGFGKPWTAHARLPGGDMPDADFDGYAQAFRLCYPQLPAEMLDGLIARYGTLAVDLLGKARTLADLGEDFGGGLSQREVLYLRDNEWARTPDDILWRRTKAGLHIAPERLHEVYQRIARCLEHV
ncbi:MAG TPA: glycerol-3-phosphate dehydrogenase [Hyphomicrobiaceae bacterium]|nr:glycerol-3-phosphate dehydrogenase [Hyphomicrobiaceae bacterium]